MQPKAIAHPTRCPAHAIGPWRKLARLARQGGLHVVRAMSGSPSARQSMIPGATPMRIEFKRTRRELKFLRIRLGRVIRDIRRKIAGRPDLRARFPTRCSTLAIQAAASRDHRHLRPEDRLRCTPPGSSASAKRKGPRTLRVRLQSERRNAGHVTEGRYQVRAACQGCCTAIPSMATPLATDGVADLEELHRRPYRRAASTSTKACRGHNANKLPRHGSAARSVVPPRPYGARCRAPRRRWPSRSSVTGQGRAPHGSQLTLKGREGDRINAVLAAAGGLQLLSC